MILGEFAKSKKTEILSMSAPDKNDSFQGCKGVEDITTTL